MAAIGVGWAGVDGNAVDIAVSQDGTAFHTSRVGDIYVWNGRSWDATGMQTGVPDAVAGGPGGEVWFVGLYGGIHSYSRGAGHRDLQIGAATNSVLDIAVGHDGTLYRVWHDPNSLSRQAQIPRLGVRPAIPGLGFHSCARVGAGAPGRVWLAREGASIAYFEGNQVTSVAGWASDIGVGPAGEVWHVGSNGALFYLSNGQWVGVEGSAKRVAVGPGGIAWHVNDDGAIYRRV